MKKALRLMVMITVAAGMTIVMAGCQEKKAETADTTTMEHPAHGDETPKDHPAH